MRRVPILVHGVVAYALFVAVFLYFVGFVAGARVPKGIDDGVVGSPLAAAVVDLLLVALFAIQHSVMARPWFKRAWTTVVPEPAERSTYVALASLSLALLMWGWRPIPAVVWDAAGTSLGALLAAVAAAGWAFVALSTFAIDHLHLFGLRQAWFHWLGRELPPPDFRVRGPYRLVRHPLMLGFLVAFWAAPTMTVGHLLFALAMTGYVLVAVMHEERDLRAAHGAAYAGYAARTPRINPFARR